MGGIGMKNLELFNKAILAMLAWKLLIVDSFANDSSILDTLGRLIMFHLLFGQLFWFCYRIFILFVIGFWVGILKFLSW